MGAVKKVQIRNGFSDRNNIDKLNKAIDYIADIYYDFYKTLNKEDLRVELLEKKVDGKVYIENDISGDYIVDTKMYEEECGGDVYMTCEDLEYYWYNDRKFLDEYEEDDDNE